MPTILVADDDRAVRAVIRAMLERHGYQVLTACDGHEAVAIFESRSGEIDLALLDVDMPVMTGPQALARLQEAKPGLPVILVSGWCSGETAAGLSGRPVDFLPKPFNDLVLSSKIQAALSGHRRGPNYAAGAIG